MSPSRCHRQDVTAQPRSPAPLIVHQWSCINGRDVDGADEDISGQKGLTKAHCWPGGSWIQAPPRQTASLRAWLRGDAPPMSLLNKDPTQSLRSEARRYVGQPEAGGEHGLAAAPQRPDRAPWAGTDSAATSGAAGGAQGL